MTHKEWESVKYLQLRTERIQAPPRVEVGKGRIFAYSVREMAVTVIFAAFMLLVFVAATASAYPEAFRDLWGWL